MYFVRPLMGAVGAVAAVAVVEKGLAVPAATVILVVMLMTVLAKRERLQAAGEVRTRP